MQDETPQACPQCMTVPQEYSLYFLPQRSRSVFLQSFCQAHFEELVRDVQREGCYRLSQGRYPGVSLDRGSQVFCTHPRCLPTRCLEARP